MNDPATRRLEMLQLANQSLRKCDRELRQAHEALQAVWDYHHWDDWEEITGPPKLKRAYDLTRDALGLARVTLHQPPNKQP